MRHAAGDLQDFAGRNNLLDAIHPEQQLAGLNIGKLFVRMAVLRHQTAFGEIHLRNRHGVGMNHLARKLGIHLFPRDLIPLMQLHSLYHTGIVPVLVNGERIEDQTIREEARAIRPKLEEAMAGEDPRAIETRVKQWARENVIERVLLQQAALSDPEPVPEEEIEKHLSEIRPENGGCIAPGTESQVRQEIELRYRIDRLFNRACANLSAEPRNKDITDFYRKNKDQFLSEEVIHAAHIVKNVDEKQDDATARAGIEAAAAELAKPGADFTEVADRLSDCPGRGGDLGWFPRGQMVEEFEHIVFAMSPGQTSGIFRSPFGYHIARLIERKPAGPMPLEEVRDQIAATLQQEKRQKLIEQYLDKLWTAAKIEDVAS